MKSCNVSECNNEFIPESNRQAYCSNKCKNREAYTKFKASGGNRYRDSQITYTLTCASRDCNKEFDTTNKMKKYCSVPCSKKEIQKQNAEHGSKSSYQLKEKKEYVCGYRNCQVEFKSSHNRAKFCCVKHSKQEAYIANADKIKPNRVIQIRHPEQREKRFAIPHFSAKWLEKLWNNRRTA